MKINISRNIFPFLVIESDSIREALEKIDSNEKGVVICVDEVGILLGVLTDGDFRRWAITESTPDLNMPVGTIVRRDIVSAKRTDGVERLGSLIGHRIRFIPLVDSGG